MKASRQIALTPDLVARVHRAIADPGPEPGLVYHADEDYDALVLARCRAVRLALRFLVRLIIDTWSASSTCCILKRLF